LSVDWLFSVANLAVLSREVLAKAVRGAINFHDGPLPRYAGINAPVWALVNRETRHGVTWHLIERRIDEGDIVEQRLFAIDPGETALTLNAKCYGAAIDSFGALLASLEAEGPKRSRQALDQRSYFGRWERPAAAARLDFSNAPEDVVALVRGLDFGRYWNPLARPKIDTGAKLLLVGQADIAPGAEDSVPGTVLEVSDNQLVVAAGSGAVALSGLTDMAGVPVSLTLIPTVGMVLPCLAPEAAEALTRGMAAAARGDGHWRHRLAALAPAR
jgi:methionyl-tRNA formyltransferase